MTPTLPSSEELLLSTQSLKVLLLKPGIQPRMLRLLTGISSLLISKISVHSPAFFKSLSRVFPVLAVANTGSCVGPHPGSSSQTTDAGSRAECPRNIHRLHNMCYSFCVFVFRNCGYNFSCCLRKWDFWQNDLWNDQLGDRLEIVFSPAIILCG